MKYFLLVLLSFLFIKNTIAQGCNTPTISSENFDSGTNALTLNFVSNDVSGISNINFILLNNLTVTSAPGYSSMDGNNWNPTGLAPTSATFVLTRLDMNNDAFSYTVVLTNDCGSATFSGPNLEPIPTLSQWSIMILGFLLLIFGILSVKGEIYLNATKPVLKYR